MLEFGQLEVVEKTFTRKETAPRGQKYEGIKFRRYKSEAGEKEALKEVFILSNKAFETLGLDTYALAQANFGGHTFLLVVEDQDEVKPEAKILRQSYKGEGENRTKLAKGKMFNNVFLKEALEAQGVLEAGAQPDTEGVYANQYISLTDVTSEVNGLPSVVKAVYKLDKDTTVDAANDTEVSNDEKEF